MSLTLMVFPWFLVEFGYSSINMIDVLVIGQGGREHAIAWNLSKSPKINNVYVSPGNAGTSLDAGMINVEIDINNHTEIINFVKDKGISLTIVGPEAPLVEGIVDKFNEEKLRIFGPSQDFAKLEGSKEFAKKFMQKYSIPTAHFHISNDINDAKKHVDQLKLPIVLKADGLAAGKGVFICHDNEEVDHALNKLFNIDKFNSIVVEEFLVGQELSAIYICNFRGCSYEIGLPWTKDYKSRDEYNSGPNTGGMGAVSHPFCYQHKNSIYKNHIEIEKILTKTIIAINDVNKSNKSGYLGFLYLGLMIDAENNIKVLEYNCRLGDPETQNLMLHLTKKDVSLLDLIENNPQLSVQDYNLDRISSETEDYCCTIVLAAKGYPESYKKDFYIDLEDVNETENIKIFHSGTILQNSKIKSTGGRILSINVFSENKEDAIKTAYNEIKKIRCYEDENFTFENNDFVFFREDIGQ